MEEVKNLLDRYRYFETEKLPCFKWGIKNLPSEIYKIVTRKKFMYSGSVFPKLHYYRFKKRYPNTFILFKLLVLKQKLPVDYVEKFIPKTDLEVLLKSDLIKSSAGYLEANYKVTSFLNNYFLNDFDEKITKNFVHIGFDSYMLADKLNKLTFKGINGLDIGTGTGVQAIIMTKLCSQVYATDINPRATLIAKKTATLNNKKITVRESNLFGKENRKYDLIVSNPPFIFYPESKKDYLHGYSGQYGMETTLDIIKGLDNWLSGKGTAIVLTSSPTINGNDLLMEKVREILGSKNFEIVFEETRYLYRAEDKKLYDPYNISHFVNYILTITRSNSFRIKKIKMRPLIRLLNKLNVFLAKH